MRLIIFTAISIVAFVEASLAQIGISVASNGSVHLFNPSETNQQYFLERSFDLMGWDRQGTIVQGAGSSLKWTNTPANPNRAFSPVLSGPLISQRLYGLNFSP